MNLRSFFLMLLGMKHCTAQPYNDVAVCPASNIVPIYPPVRPIDTIQEAYFNLLQMKTGCETYSMSHYNNYDQNGIFTYQNHYHLTGIVPHDWGHHALFWKGFVWWDECDVTGLFCSYHGGFAQNLDPPPSDTYYVKCNDKNRLNSIEGNPNSPFRGSTSNMAGTQTSRDPNGGWLCVQEYSPHVAAVVAAMSMYFWETPVYLNLDWGQYDNSHSWDYKAGVIEKVTLCSMGTNDKPHEVCGWDTNNWDLASASACSSSLILDTVTVSFFGSEWTGPLTSDYHEFTEHVTFNAVDFAQIYDSNMNSGIGAMIMDPPEGTTEKTIKDLLKVAKASAKKMKILKKNSTRLIQAGKNEENEQPNECYAQYGQNSLYIKSKQTRCVDDPDYFFKKTDVETVFEEELLSLDGENLESEKEETKLETTTMKLDDLRTMSCTSRPESPDVCSCKDILTVKGLKERACDNKTTSLKCCKACK